MSELISGKEAKLAWVNGEQLQVVHVTHKVWEDLNDKHPLDVFTSNKYIFRLKPRTTINGIEVPAPFEPKVGDEYWFIADYISSGYSVTKEGAGINSTIGKWRTEEEIKKVVEALRKVFNP